MDKRTKIMAGVFGLLIVYVLGAKVVYPVWIEPIVTIDDRIASKQKELDKLEAKSQEVARAKREYLRFMDRAGALDMSNIENDVRIRLNKLIERFGLTDAKVARGRPGLVPKTEITRMVLTIGAEGTLESTLSFLRAVYEMPYLLRVGNVTLNPLRSGGRRTSRPTDRIALRVPLEIWALPQHRMLERKIEEDDLVQPEQVVRHADLVYAKIWERSPFMEFVPLPPLKVTLPPSQTAQVGARLQLQGSAQGGDGEYTYQWSPRDGLGSPERARTTVETAVPGKLVYTLTVRDNSDHTATARVTISVNEKPKPPKVVVHKDVPPPVPKAPPATRTLWPDRKYQRLSMTLSHWNGTHRVDEVLVHDAKTDESAYYGVGDEFDGGQLVLVHPRGAITRWENPDAKRDEFFIYPIGSQLSGDLKPDEATEYPYLRLAAQKLAEESAPWSESENAEADLDRQSDGDREEEGGEGRSGEAADDPKAGTTAKESVTQRAAAKDAKSDSVHKTGRAGGDDLHAKPGQGGRVQDKEGRRAPKPISVDEWTRRREEARGGRRSAPESVRRAAEKRRNTKKKGRHRRGRRP